MKIASDDNDRHFNVDTPLDVIGSPSLIKGLIVSGADTRHPSPMSTEGSRNSVTKGMRGESPFPVDKLAFKLFQ